MKRGVLVLPKDAPDPWGPWTAAFATEAWDVGPGETAGFPPKWISPDGRTMHLVFSGNDCFSVRRATLVLQGEVPRNAGKSSPAGSTPSLSRNPVRRVK